MSEDTNKQCEDLEVEFIPDDYPYAPAGDAQLRCFVLECMGTADIDPDVMIVNMERVIAWIKGGVVIERPFKLHRIATTGPGAA